MLFSYAAATVGVRVVPGGNAWSTLSDRNLKENLMAVNGEAFLEKIAAFKLSSWNYKGQHPSAYRHYGPMAQEFYQAFGKDAYGTIGNDTTINQADFDGVNFIAIQALERRTSQLQEENTALKQTVTQLKAAVAQQQHTVMQRLKELETIVAALPKTAGKEAVAAK